MFRLIVIACLVLGASITQAADIADSAETVTPVLIGTHVPDIKIRALDGNLQSLLGITAGKPTVLVFYRGGWCPFCNQQLSQLNGIENKLSAMGYQIVALTPDPPEQIKKTLDKHSLKYAIYSDTDLATIKAFGVGFRLPESTVEKYRGYGITLSHAPGETDNVLPVPSVFIIDAEGVVQFVYVNPDYRIRLSSELLLTAAKTSLKVKPLEPKK
jgi:peroxiredoxin